MSSAEMHIIVLAADAGRGRDSPWQLEAVNGVPLLQLMLSRAIAVAGHAVRVVLGAQARELAPALGRSPASLVVCRDWVEGPAAPIRAGLHGLPGSCDGALLLHADQPGVSSADLQRLVDVWRRNPRLVVAAQYGGSHGLPAIFPRSVFASLLGLRGAAGAGVLLRAPHAALVGVPMPAAAPDPELAAAATPAPATAP